MPSFQTYVDTEAMKLIIGSELEETITRFLGEYQKTVTRLTAAGMPANQIRRIIENDLQGSGRLFGQLKNGISKGVGRGAGDISGEVSEQVQVKKKIKKFRWVTVSVKPCPDCSPRHNRKETMSTWRKIGKPRSGFSVCQGSCKCRLVAEKYKGRIKKPIIRQTSYLNSNMAGKHKSIKQAEAWANHNYKNVQFDYIGMELRSANDLNKQYKILAKDFPEVSDRLEYVGTFRNYIPNKAKTPGYSQKYFANKRRYKWAGKRRNWIGFAVQDGYTIGLNPKYYGNYDFFKKSVSRLVNSGYHPLGCANPASILTHEWGHMVENWIRRDLGNVAVAEYYAATDAVGLVRSTFQEFIDAWRLNSKARLSVSEYSMESMRETWAEAFSQVYHASNDVLPEFSRRVKYFLEEILDRSRWVKPVDAWYVIRDQAAKDKIKYYLAEIRELLGILPPQ